MKKMKYCFIVLFSIIFCALINAQEAEYDEYSDYEDYYDEYDYDKEYVEEESSGIEPNEDYEYEYQVSN